MLSPSKKLLEIIKTYKSMAAFARAIGVHRTMVTRAVRGETGFNSKMIRNTRRLTRMDDLELFVWVE